MNRIGFTVEKEPFTLGLLVKLVQDALKADIELTTPIFANVKFSVTTPAPLKTLVIGKTDG